MTQNVNYKGTYTTADIALSMKPFIVNMQITTVTHLSSLIYIFRVITVSDFSAEKVKVILNYNY